MADMAAELAALDAMTVSELGARYEEAFGEPTRSHNKEYLKKQIAWRIQEQAEGGLSKRPQALAAEIGEGGKARWRRKSGGGAEPLPGSTPRNKRDPRLPPPGTAITREYKGAVRQAVPRTVPGRARRKRGCRAPGAAAARTPRRRSVPRGRS